jgi:N-acetylglucosamine transport system permease protein
MKRFLANSGLFLFGMTIVIPLLWVLMSSIKSSPEITNSPWSLPTNPQWQNFSNAWAQAGISRFFLNSLVVTLGTLAILIPTGAMAAYIFAKYPFRGRNTLFGAFLGGMMFPNFLVIVPLFFLLKNLHLLDTKLGLILVYVAYSLSFTIFVLTGFFESLPNELGEAAQLDGATHAGTFWKVMLPLARPGMVVVAIFNAIGLWNEYGLALVLLNSEENRTLPLGIANLVMVHQYQSDWGALFAALVIVMLPVMAVYWVFRERIHDTMLAGAIKG